MRADIIVFDCDGVLIDSMDIKVEAMRKIGEPFGPELRDRLALFQSIEGGIHRSEKFKWLYQEAYGREITEAEMQKCCDDYIANLGEAVYNCPSINGLDEILEYWHTKKELYVCSGTPEQELEDILKTRGLGKYFKYIGGYPPLKTELLNKIITMANVLPEHVVMVGDTVTDSRAADELGTMFYGIGKYFEGTKYPHGKDLTDLHAWLKENIND